MAVPRRFLLLLLLQLAPDLPLVSSLVLSSSSRRRHAVRRTSLGASSSDANDLDYLKQELSKYIEKRRELGGDEAAQAVVGKVIGGTKGNKVLEFVSGAPNKEFAIQAPPNVFDYDELSKYGFSHLATPIMQNGGRNRMYELLDMDAPAIPPPPVMMQAPKLEIDRTSPAQYSGLKLGLLVNQDLQGQELERVQKLLAQGEQPAASGVWKEVESFDRPFQNVKKNVGPKETPLWTAEKLDKYATMQGRVQSWARAAKKAKKGDVFEQVDYMNLSQKLYSIATAVTAAVAFGKASPAFFGEETAEIVQAPAAALLLASVGSAIYCAILAESRNRSKLSWSIKGWLGGPLSIRQLQALPRLEQDNN